MITFDIELLGKLQHIPRAIFHTKAAPLAAITDHMNLTSRHFYPVRIERFPPKLHIRSPN